MLKTVKDACKIHPSTLDYQVAGEGESLAQVIDASDEGKSFFEKSCLTRGTEDLLYEGLLRLSWQTDQALFDLFGSLPDTIEDEWIEQIETLYEKLDEYINAQKRVNGFDIRYNNNLDAEEDEWRNCARVLSRRSIDTLIRNGW